MKKILPIMTVFLVIMSTLVILAGFTSFTAKAEVPHGVISISFDDNYQDQFDYAFPLMQTRGITGTFYVVTNQVSDFSGDASYMSIAELQILQVNGNEIGSHSKTHSDFIYLTDAQIVDECDTSKKILQSNGLTVTNFAYPDGLTNDHVDSIVKQYYRSGRTAYVGPYLMEAPTDQFRLAGFSAETANSSALSLLKGMVDQVYSTSGWAIIFFHNIKPDAYSEPYTTSTQDFASFLDYIISKGVQTHTVNQVLNLTPLSITTNFGTVAPSSGLYDLDNALAIEAFSPAASDGERYSWNGWVGTGNGSYSGLNNPATITMNGPITQNASWRHEYKLTVTTNFGNTAPSVGEYWYEEGTHVNAEASAPSATTGERYVWLGWTGSGIGSYSGYDNPASITMEDSITETSMWEHEYYLNVSSVNDTADGSGWYDSGSTACAMVASLEVAGAAGTRYIFTSWNGDASGTTSPSNPITMNSPKTATAVWKTQYYLTISSAYGIVSGSGWCDSGASAYAMVTPLTVLGAAGTQYNFTGWNGDASGTMSPSNAIIMNSPKTAMANWTTQFYLIVFSAFGSPSSLSGWYDNGSSITGAVTSPVSGGAGTQYVCTGWTGTGSAPASGTASALTFTITAASNITWNWKTQYLMSFAASPSAAATTSPSGTNVWQDAGSISIAATPYAGYRFSSWSSDTSNITFAFTTLSSTTATINGPGTITANIVNAPAATPAPTYTPAPTASPTLSPSPSPSPAPTSSPSHSPTVSPSSSASQSPSSVNAAGTYVVYGAVVALVIGGAIAAVTAMKKIKVYL